MVLGTPLPHKQEEGCRNCFCPLSGITLNHKPHPKGPIQRLEMQGQDSPRCWAGKDFAALHSSLQPQPVSHLQRDAWLAAPAPRCKGTGSPHTVGGPCTPAFPALTASTVSLLPEQLAALGRSWLQPSLNLPQEIGKKEKMMQSKLQSKHCKDALLLLQQPFALLLAPSNSGLGRHGPILLTSSPQAGVCSTHNSLHQRLKAAQGAA